MIDGNFFQRSHSCLASVCSDYVRAMLKKQQHTNH